MRLLRIMAALLYDLFIVVALWFLTASIAMAFNHGQAIAPGNRYFQMALLAVTFLYFYLSLRKRGQTIGMIAWRLRWR